MSEAADRWRRDLEGRTIPAAILEAAPESPWGFPTELFRLRAERAGTREPTPTTLRALEALPEGGSALDVGCGSGATSLPLASHVSRVIGVDASADMLATFREAAAARGVAVETVEGGWPDVAMSVPVCDVAVCGHVVYNAPDLPPFLSAITTHVRRRVVIELTEHHPLRWMNDLWERFHGVRFPDGPTADDAATVARELGADVHREELTMGPDRGHGGFERRDDAVALARRRLCLTADRDDEVAEALGDRLRPDADGLWSTGPLEQTIVTLWWDVAPGVSPGTPPRT
jgi:SAM-dependent methyltransferase